MVQAWDRQPKEGDKAWIAFVAYRDAGPSRRIKEVNDGLGRPPASHRQLEEWSSKHAWVDRCRAYDAHLDQVKQRATETDIAKRAREHAKLGRNMQAVAGAGLAAMFRKVKDGDGERLVLNRPLKASEMAQLAKVGVELERVAEGMATEISEVRDTRPIQVVRREIPDVPDDRPKK